MGSHSKNTRKPSYSASANSAPLWQHYRTIKNCLINRDIKLIDESIYAPYANVNGALGVDFFIDLHISLFLFNTKKPSISCH